MDMMREFEALREANRRESDEELREFLKKNDDMKPAMQKGLSIEYVSESDHLYITFGENRVGMAWLMGNIVALADPETLECIGIEIPDFRKLVDSGALEGPWARLAEITAWIPMLQIPPSAPSPTINLPEEAEESGIRPDLAEGVRRELVLAPA